MKVKIAHVVNVFSPDYNSELYTAQPITLESMRMAQEFVRGEVHVELFAAYYEEDAHVVPDYFSKTKPLTRSVLEAGSFHKKRKLPLIADILQRLFDATDADYLIYTNNDIILQPCFYQAVNVFIAGGIDAFIINRRRIKGDYTNVSELPLIFAEMGKSHPGFDCFVFKRDIFPKMHLEDICIGVPFIGVTLAHNLFCFARKFKLFDDVHLTKHIGMEILGQRDEFYWHNRKAFNKNLKKLKPHIQISKFPYADKPLFSRYYKWGRNPSLFVFMNLKLEIKGVWGKFGVFLNRFF